MNRKIHRFTLLIPIIAIFIFIGMAVTMKVNSSTIQSSNPNFNSEETSLDFPANYNIYEFLGTEACGCIGPSGWKEYSDEIPPDLVVKSPPNNSLVFPNVTIYVECDDNYPAIQGGMPLVPAFIYYNL